MEKKIEQGAQFFQTQAVYDPKLFETFVRRVEGFKVPVQLGLVIIKSPKMAKYMNEHVSGITVPEALVKEMASVPPAQYKAKAGEITMRLAKEMGPMVQGIHFMPMGWSDLVPPVVQELRK
jgi:methylenetetrahydrofolate reductase (NADPH)